MTFRDALTFTLPWEGGYVDDPDDRGGATNRGVTQATYDAWRHENGKARRPVRKIEDAEVEEIYRTRYWHAARCDDVAARAPRLAAAHFDSAVNHGPARAAMFLQRAVGAAADGKIGPATLAALDAALHAGGDRAVVARYLAARRAFYEAIVARDSTQKKFLKGWMRRVEELEKITRGPA